MRRTTLIISIIVAVTMDYWVFPDLCPRIAPDALIAVFVSLSVLTGLIPAAPTAAATSVVLDICFNRFIGMSAIPLIVSVFIGYMFYRNFFADNAIVPAIAAVITALFKEIFMLLVLIISGGKINGGFALFAMHMLPASLLTGVICALIHLLLKKYLPGSAFRQDMDYTR